MSPFAILAFAFVAVPLMELWLLIEVGSRIGALTTVVLVVLTALAGVGLLRWQGFETLRRAQAGLAQGVPPAVELVEGALLAAGGALLLTPGFLTDAVGFALLVPAWRHAAARMLLRRWLGLSPTARGPGGPPKDGPRTIEGEWRRWD